VRGFVCLGGLCCFHTHIVGDGHSFRYWVSPWLHPDGRLSDQGKP
jgi:hypothetical protein